MNKELVDIIQSVIGNKELVITEETEGECVIMFKTERKETTTSLDRRIV